MKKICLKILYLLTLAFLITVIQKPFTAKVKAEAVEEFVDPFTGLTEAQMLAEEKKGEVTITSSMKYDSIKNRYVYYISSSDSVKITSTAADGMYLASNAEVEFPTNGAGIIYHDGKEITDNPDNTYSKPGRYEVRVNVQGEEKSVFSFTIVGKKANSIYSYNIPEGFTLKSVQFNDNDIKVGSSSVNLTEEGKYKISYQCNRTGIPYTLETEIDRTAPTLLLAAVENGVADGPVDISDRGEENSILVYLNDQQINYSPELTAIGKYRLLLSDEAGNTTEYSFDIIPYLNTNAKIVIGALIIAIIALIVYLYVGKKKLKVR